MNQKVIGTNEVMDVINTVKRGQFFSMFFERVAPKCPVCGKSSKKWIGLLNCPDCGAELSYMRETIAQVGVYNPHNEDIKPKGTGESAQEAKLDNRIKFYDMNAINPDETKGGYRQCRAELVKRIRANDTEYVVK